MERIREHFRVTSVCPSRRVLQRFISQSFWHAVPPVTAERFFGAQNTRSQHAPMLSSQPSPASAASAVQDLTRGARRPLAPSRPVPTAHRPRACALAHSRPAMPSKAAQPPAPAPSNPSLRPRPARAFPAGRAWRPRSRAGCRCGGGLVIAPCRRDPRSRAAPTPS